MTAVSDRLDGIQLRIDRAGPGGIAIFPSDIAWLRETARKQDAALEAVRALHFSNGGHNPDCHCGVEPGAGALCKGCHKYWPCPTAQALEGKP